MAANPPTSRSVLTLSAQPGSVPQSQLADRLPRPVAFVLDGSASLGAVQVDMLQAGSEMGLAPDVVAGTSAGSVNGAPLAADPRSAAVPGLYPPARLDGRDLVDGGVVVSNVPIDHALRMGARSVVVLDCGPVGYLRSLPRFRSTRNRARAGRER